MAGDRCNTSQASKFQIPNNYLYTLLLDIGVRFCVLCVLLSDQAWGASKTK